MISLFIPCLFLGQKIKLIREETGALITTPGEYEDHVFIIEAPPDIALHVANIITSRANEITQSKMTASERRRGSTSSIPGCMSLFPVNGVPNGTPSGRLVNRSSPDNLLVSTNANLSSPLPLIKTASNSIAHGGTNGNGVGAVNPGDVFCYTNSCNGSVGMMSSAPNGNPSAPSNGNGNSNGRILLARSKISVPQDMVGKIIGTQGSIITTIQKDTGTEIKSPPKEAARGPSATSEFEISAYQSLGMTSNQAAEFRVQQAKQLIGHLVMRQLERRASEEVEDSGSSNAGKSRSNSAGEEGADDSKPTKTVGWMWPDVAQLDSKEAREVLDRILSESKNKTRRAKELAAAAAATTAAAAAGSLPSSPCNPNIGMGNCNNGGTFVGEFFPSEKATVSCHNSPFHQARAVPQNSVFQSPPNQVNMLGGFMSERRLTSAFFI